MESKPVTAWKVCQEMPGNFDRNCIKKRMTVTAWENMTATAWKSMPVTDWKVSAIAQKLNKVKTWKTDSNFM